MAKKKRANSKKSQKGVVSTPSGNPSAGVPWVTLGLLTVAFGIAAYLGWTRFQSGSVVGCGPESGCGDVLSSRWSSWFGVPVSLLALPLYGFLFFSILASRAAGARRRSDASVAASLAASVIVILAAVWFTGVQAFILKKFCPWCLTAHAAGCLAALLVVRSHLSSVGQPLSLRASWIAAVVGCLGVTLMVGGQLVYQPDTFAVDTLENGAGGEDASAVADPYQLSLHGGRFSLKASEYPLIGKSEAGNYVLSLFDYTCQHCRATHPKIKTLHASFPDELAVVSLPMPLNGDCNEMMRKRGRRTNEAHDDACHYASASLAVYRLKPEAWAEYDDWLFEGGAPPTLGRAVSRAAEVVGDMEALQQTMQSAPVQEMIKLSVSIYEANVLARGKGTMPQVVIGNSIVTGEINDPSRLYALVAEEFGLLR